MAEARSWCERRQLNKGYVLRTKGKHGPTPARAEKKTASRFYQLKSGHGLTGVSLKGTKNRPEDHCWWCDPENDSGAHQTRDHLSKHCYKWKDQQAAIQRGDEGGGAWATCWRITGSARWP